MPWEFIDEPERYNLTLKGTVMETTKKLTPYRKKFLNLQRRLKYH